MENQLQSSTETPQSEEANNDLVWDLQRFKQYKRAAAFIKMFENKLCVYSHSVEQLYTNYSIFFPEDYGRKMVVLPNPHSYHDTFFNISAASVRATGLNIVPGEVVGRDGLHITVPVRTRTGEKTTKVVPLEKGLNLINKRMSEGQRFLPVLVKGDLREFEARVPILHVHRIQVDMLTDRSSMERDSIKHVIEDHLSILLEEQ